MLVRNGDAYLQNFAVMYDDQRTWLSPLHDQATTTIYTYERSGGIGSAHKPWR